VEAARIERDFARRKPHELQTIPTQSYDARFQGRSLPELIALGVVTSNGGAGSGEGEGAA
jgi:hypothetical protein